MVLRFAHISDCHIGCWHNHPELENKPLQAFERVINSCISQKVDFILIAGDLFDTNLPSIDVVRDTVKLLKKTHDKGIDVFIVAGSHDFSPSGKTMISVLDSAGLVKDVAKYKETDNGINLSITEGEKVLLAGMVGKRAGLESELFKKIVKPTFTPEQNEKFKIFMFHSAIEEYKPDYLKEMHALPISALPKGFDYYATGHVHHTFEMKEDGLGAVIFPGALFPCNFLELEKNKTGGFYIVEINDKKELKVEWQEIKLIDIESFKFNADGKTADILDKEIKDKIQSDIKQTDNTLVLIRIAGMLESGKPSDVKMNFADTMNILGLKKNISKLQTKEFEELELDTDIKGDIDALENKIISDHLGQLPGFGKEEKKIIKDLMQVLKEEKQEETAGVYNSRVLDSARKVLGL